MTTSSVSKLISVGALLSKNKFVIPTYQRDYAWTDDTISQLFEDIFKKAESAIDTNYFIGSISLVPRADHFEVLDGQQRLTTLFLMAIWLKRNHKLSNIELWTSDSLKFEARELSEVTIEQLGNKNYLDENQAKSGLNNALHLGYKCIDAILQKIGNDTYLNYLLSNVKIVWTEVSPKIDFNRYFEVINMRGVQLELHEILKARMLDNHFGDVELKTLGNIWAKCSEMFYESDNSTDPLAGESVSIESILSGNVVKNEINISNIVDEQGDGQKSYPIVNFEHILLMNLKQYNDNTPLNDKQLLSAFKGFDYKKDGSQFITKLNKVKRMFNDLIIRRDSNEEFYISKWHESKIIDRAKLKHLMQVQTFLEVAFSAKNYKNWLVDYILALVKDESTLSSDIDSQIKYLENWAYDYFRKNIDTDNLNNGTGTLHFAFLFLDYLLWREYTNDADAFNKWYFDREYLYDDNFKRSCVQKIVNIFSFKSRTSVEHYYPQNIEVDNRDKDVVEIINNFGNLCLLSRSKNSSLSNRMPSSKKDYYLKSDSIDSCKQHLMMCYKEWNIEAVNHHQDKMIDVLNRAASILGIDS